MKGEEKDILKAKNDGKELYPFSSQYISEEKSTKVLKNDNNFPLKLITSSPPFT